MCDSFNSSLGDSTWWSFKELAICCVARGDKGDMKVFVLLEEKTYHLYTNFTVNNRWF
jgi:hypothetical protein